MRDRLVIRLQKDMSDAAVAELSKEYADLVVKGTIQKTGALVEEANEPELDDKPRLVFTLNRQSPSRLYEMIMTINELGRGAK